MRWPSLFIILVIAYFQPCKAVERISFQTGTGRVTVAMDHEGIHVTPVPESLRAKAYNLNLASVEALGSNRLEFAEKIAQEAVHISSSAKCELNDAYIVLGWVNLEKDLDKSIEFLNKSISDRIVGEVTKYGKMPRDSEVACFGFEFWDPDLSLAIEIAKKGKPREVVPYLKKVTQLYLPADNDAKKNTIETLKKWANLLESKKIPQSKDRSQVETYFPTMPDTRPDLFGGVKPNPSK